MNILSQKGNCSNTLFEENNMSSKQFGSICLGIKFSWRNILMSEEVASLLEYVDKIVDDKDKILTDIYKITNVVTQKLYIGQSNTHRMNHKRYRPFGYKKRFDDHMSEALCNTKKKQCTLLNNSLRKYGRHNFSIELLERCLPQHSNEREIFWIQHYNCIAPKGYNLSLGGKKGCQTEEQRRKTMEKNIKNYLPTKINKFIGVTVDLSNIYSYIRQYKTYDETYYKVKIQNKTARFYGKFFTQDELQQQVIDFIHKVHDLNVCNTPKLRENPEASTTTPIKKLL